MPKASASSSEQTTSEEVTIKAEPTKKAPAKKTSSTPKKALIIVESPSKAKTIQKYLGRAYTVKASVGHIKDLPKSKLGVDVDKGFKPDYQVIKGKDKIIADIKKAAEGVKEVYLAPDPDREGEAIAWHIAEEIPKKGKKIHRVLFNSVTKAAILEAMQHPVELNKAKFHSQQARRILDRLVGYKISPLLWDKVRRGLSAGRVQSVAVRMVVDRDQEIKAFKTEEYWTIDVLLEKDGKPFTARLAKVDGKDPELPNKQTVDDLVASVHQSDFLVSSVETKERTRRPQAPFITSRMQQDASRKLGFSAKKTMTIAQHLYEGADLGDLGTHGLITYMRTDSVRIVPEAILEVRQYIEKTFGKEYLPTEPVIYKTKKSAQDAHEAIRPTSLEFAPDKIEQYLEKDEFRLYQLIWNRYVACQMNPAVYDQTTMELQVKSSKGNEVLLRVSGSNMKFPGFTAVYEEAREEGESAKKAEVDEDAAPAAATQELPHLEEGEKHPARDFAPEQHFTQPPPRFTDASLIKELEDKGIGRPSTYASILSNIQDREYVEKRENRYFPSELGIVVTDLLKQAFPEIMDAAFTAEMEEKLDLIEEGKADWVKMMRDFWKPFSKTLEQAKITMKDIKHQEIPTEHKCEKCGAVMVIKWGKLGQFLACSHYPDCKHSSEFKKDDQGKIIMLPREKSDKKCPKEGCGADLLVKNGKYGKFLACEKYPDCKHTETITTGIQCPGCKVGELAQRMSRYKRFFYGCNTFPKCNYALWDKPVVGPCPECKWPILTEKFTKRDGHMLKCPVKECGYKVIREMPPEAPATPATPAASSPAVA